MGCLTEMAVDRIRSESHRQWLPEKGPVSEVPPVQYELPVKIKYGEVRLGTLEVAFFLLECIGGHVRLLELAELGLDLLGKLPREYLSNGNLVFVNHSFRFLSYCRWFHCLVIGSKQSWDIRI